MSQASPFKQNRIDRHLSRQRGAGVRNLTTSFGFSFGLSAPPTTANPPTSDNISTEPTAKRRKSEQHIEEEAAAPGRDHGHGQSRVDDAVEEDTGAVGGRTATSISAEKDGAEEHAVPTKLVQRKRGRPKGSKAQPKSRKSKQLKENKIGHEHDFELDTASEAPAKAKCQRGKPKKAMELENDEPSAPFRPRRQAATNAMSKVTQGFVDEEAPIDKKRREPEPVKMVRKGRKKIFAAEDAAPDRPDLVEAGLPVEPQTDHPVIGEESEEEVEVLQMAARPTMPTASRQPRVKVTQKSIDDGTPLGKDSGLESPAKTVRRGREKLMASRSEAPHLAEIPEATLTLNEQTNPTKSDGDADKDPETLQELVRSTKSTVPRRRGGKKGGAQVFNHQEIYARPTNSAVKKTATTLDSETKVLETKRKPLADTNANAILQAVSPEKREEKLGKVQVAGCQVQEQARLGDADAYSLRKPKPKGIRKTAKVSVKLDARLTSNKNSERPAEETRSTGIKFTETDHKPPSKRKRVDGEAVAQDAKAPDEDVDWLFDDTQTRKKPLKARADAAAKRVTRQALSKLPDMDLDDLLTDIASIAKPGRRK